MKKTFWLLACFGILSACSCHKTPVEPAFQNSFSCKINGQLWEPNGKDGFFGFQKTLSFYFAPNETGLGIQASNRKDNQAITVACFCKNEVGSYKMKSVTPYDDFTKKCSYVTDSVKTRTIILSSIDADKRIIKGTFEFTAFNSGSCNDTLKFTEGKFELKY